MDADRALLLVLRALHHQDRTHAELRERLLAVECPAELIDATLAQVDRWGFLDERRLAGSLTERRARQAYGRERILAELAARGVPEDLAVAVVDSMIGEEDDRIRAVKALSRRYHAEDDPVRGARWLAQRGFQEDVVRSAVAEFYERSLED